VLTTDAIRSASRGSGCRRDGAVGAEPDRHAAVEQLAHGRDAAAQAQVAARVVGDGRAGGGEHSDVVVGQPHAVRADEAGPEQPVLGEPRDDTLAETALALDHLDLGLGQVRVHAHAVVAHEPGAAVEELVGRLVGNRRATATRMRPCAAPFQRRMMRSVSSSRPLVGAARMPSTVRRRSGGSRSISPGTVWKNTTSATAGASTTRTPTSV